ncbi:MAG: protoporphyrinogen oxidase, partial [Acidobacteriota bacterium]
TMKTRSEEGWLIESGPNSALETTPLIGEIVGKLGLSSSFLYADENSSKRYVVRNGTLKQVPTGPLSFLKTDLWSARGKLRLLGEPFIGRGAGEESVAQFVARRLGKELLDYGINPFVAGVYAGDPSLLSVRHAFPKLHALEAKYGGLIKGMIRSRRERKARKEVAKDRARLFSFLDGMQTLPARLSEELGGRIVCGAAAESVIPVKTARGPLYTVAFSAGGRRDRAEARAVVLSSPAEAAALVIERIDPGTAAALRSISYPPVAEVFLGYDGGQVERGLDGFGFLVPEAERRKILGTIWSSSLFPKRAPAGKVALTTFMGGARQPGLTELGDEELVGIASGELSRLMEIKGEPVFSRVIKWKKAIPQYNLGYGKILEKISRFEDNYRGTFISSNYRGGIAVGDCFINSEAVAKRIVEYLSAPGQKMHI